MERISSASSMLAIVVATHFNTLQIDVLKLVEQFKEMWFCGSGSRKWFEGRARGDEIKGEGLAMLVSGTRPREGVVQEDDLDET